MKKFTVILLYPDYLPHCDFPQTCNRWVEAENLVEAVRQAQITAAEAWRTSEGDDGLHPGEMYPLSIFEGHHIEQVGSWAADYNSRLDSEPEQLDQAA
jgi:hypothetical protein